MAFRVLRAALVLGVTSVSLLANLYCYSQNLGMSA
jgi:hypothetical protein